MIEVVHLIGQLGRGGTERQLCLLLRHSDPERFVHRVVVFNPSRHAPWNRELEDAGVEILELPSTCRGVPRRLVHLFKRLRRRRPQVIHSWTVHDNPYAGVLGLLLRAPVRWGSLRGSLHSDGIRRLSPLARFLMLRLVQRLVVNCRVLVSQLGDAGYPARRIHVLPNCVIPEPAASVRMASEDGARPDPKGAKRSARRQQDGMRTEAMGSVDLKGPLVGIVANLRRVKNPLMFVRAMGLVLPRHPGARALWVGQPLPSEPEMSARVEAEIERQGLVDRLIVTGFRDDVPAILRRLSVFCLTSDTEGMPNAVLEAMSAGLPVVATRVGGVPDLVDDGVSGHLVEPDDAEALASAVDGLLSDPGLAKEMGERGRLRAAEEHGCFRAAERLGELYERALG